MSSNFERLNKVMAKSLGVSPGDLIDAFVPACISDIDEICELRRSGFGDHLRNDRACMLWRYFSRNADVSDMLVLKLRGRVLAVVGVEPVKVHVGKCVYEGVRCADIVLDPEFMHFGIGAWMNLFIQNKYCIVSAMGSNRNSDTMVRKLFKPLSIRHHFKYPIKSFTYLSRKNIRRHIACFLRAPLDAVLFLRRLWFGSFCRPSGCRVVRLDGFGEIERFLEEGSEFLATNFFVRDPAFVQWRFVSNPMSEFLPLGLYEKDELIGYAVLKVAEQESVDGDWFLMDWQVCKDRFSEVHLRFLFKECVAIAARHGAGFLNLLLSDRASKEAAIQSGFSLRDVEDGFFLWVDESVSPDIFNSQQWFLSYADTDEVT